MNKVFRHMKACKSERPNETWIEAYKHYRWVRSLKPGDIVMAPAPKGRRNGDHLSEKDRVAARGEISSNTTD